MIQKNNKKEKIVYHYLIFVSFCMAYITLCYSDDSFNLITIVFAYSVKHSLSLIISKYHPKLHLPEVRTLFPKSYIVPLLVNVLPDKLVVFTFKSFFPIDWPLVDSMQVQ